MYTGNKVKKDLIDLCVQFIEMIDNLKKQGIIDETEYQKLVKNKKRFLEEHGRNDLKEENHG
ncbi:hypothetical protein HNQ80_003324 [Anaerosolibacter carboniphilus]|uniref:Uncharacterized protein n=1 Tax=Anaerosolibacter carboniphilus TaxID=1417629 RepID=A0A841L4F1_9FIRM|nr:hypothetical protein [Anaerosolibacter carboniphilus]MBB6217205.1 hypothetical protein [Anaerosolibacter carboniphilus]